MKTLFCLGSFGLAAAILALVNLPAEAGGKKVKVVTSSNANVVGGGYRGAPLGVYQQVLPRNELPDLTGKDKLGNSDINRLTSDRNAAETLVSSIRKKLDDTLGQSSGKPKTLGHPGVRVTTTSGVFSKKKD